MVFIIMGVSGAGKTTVGKMLAQKLSYKFYDADDFHSLQNIEKMRRGIALTDSDRAPWLKTLCLLIKNQTENAVLACSALKQSYRDMLNVAGKEVEFIYLKGDNETLRGRLLNRESHYAQANLLESQIKDLEEPQGALTLDIIKRPEDIVLEILKKFNL